MSSFFSKPCPRCGKTSLYLMTERSLQGNTIITCNECGWSHSEPNYKCLNFDGMYDNGCAEYNRSMVSKPEPGIAYPNEKSERELLEDILAELKDIRKKLNDLDKPEVVYYQLRGESVTNCSTCANYNSPIGQCERGVAGCKYEPDERERY